MLGPADYFIWFLGTFLEVGVVVCSVYRKSFKRYFFLNLYMILSATASAGRFLVLQRNGWDSLEYRYFYFFSDALLTIAFEIVSRAKPPHRYDPFTLLREVAVARRIRGGR